jgi:hypothetical protein
MELGSGADDERRTGKRTRAIGSEHETNGYDIAACALPLETHMKQKGKNKHACMHEERR